MAEEDKRQISTMLMPVSETLLLVPGSAVAEIIPWEAPAPVADKPEWFLGYLSWRSLKIPVFSFEHASGAAKQKVHSNMRYAIVNGLSKTDSLPFYAVPLDGIPSTLKLQPNDLQPLEAAENPMVSHLVSVNGTVAVIPKLDSFENLLLEAVA